MKQNIWQKDQHNIIFAKKLAKQFSATDFNTIKIHSQFYPYTNKHEKLQRK